MSIFETLAQKPWLPSQEKKDNLHTGKSFEFDSSRVALICFLGSITALFSLFFVAYVGYPFFLEKVTKVFVLSFKNAHVFSALISVPS